MLKHRLVLAASLLAFVATGVFAETPWTVKQDWVSAHEAFLASDALRGRGSATHDEAVAAAYVAAQFQSYGLKPAPGMDGYIQTAGVIKPKISGPVSLKIGDATASDGFRLIYTSAKPVSGRVAVATSDDPAKLPSADIVLIANMGKATAGGWSRAALAKGAKLVVFRDNAALQARYGTAARAPSVASYLEESPPQSGLADIAILPAEAFDRLVATKATTGALDLGEVTMEKAVTSNAIAYLPGSDPAAGVILVTAHLDHLGVQPDGTIMHGANDDASGTVAVMEVAHALAAAPQPKRGVLFVAYGSEEIGGLGSHYFADHPPIPLEQIVANLEFEMIGAQDPKMAKGELMITGFERSNLGETLKAKGALIASDPYPEQNFFERSDNYSLALKGIVAHTISGWAVTPTYHDKTDDIAHLDLPFMTAAIQSLIVPVEYLINSDFKPEWKSGGKPEVK